MNHKNFLKKSLLESFHKGSPEGKPTLLTPPADAAPKLPLLAAACCP